MGAAALVTAQLSGEPLVSLRNETFVWAVHKAEGYVYGPFVGRALDWVVGQMMLGSGLLDVAADRPI
jgi:hypothetical protein